MDVVPKKVGHSTARVVPRPVLRDLGIRADQHLRLETTADERVVFTPKHEHEHVLSALIAQRDPDARPPKDLALWDVARPVGQEVW